LRGEEEKKILDIGCWILDVWEFGSWDLGEHKLHYSLFDACLPVFGCAVVGRFDVRCYHMVKILDFGTYDRPLATVLFNLV
jgi:hypothetical protein